MINIKNKSECCGCAACAQICPVGCIVMKDDAEGFMYPEAEAEKCIQCGECNSVCPVLNRHKGCDRFSQAFAAINLNESTREKSSSGGIFSLLAEKTLEKGGVVFGAAFDANYRSVRHIGIEKSEELDKLRESKYLQSGTTDAFQQVRSYLENNRSVLFSGTPCQVEALLSYLAKPYDNLFCVDLICHGTPSPMIWRCYLDSICSNNTEIRKVSFRDKEESWKKYSLVIKTDSGEHRMTCSEDPYMKAFLSNLSLRPSCYSCPFKTVERASDMTLADYWGIENTDPGFDDDRGVSLVITHSEKGNAMLEKLSAEAVIKQSDISNALKYNPSIIASPYEPHKRSYFFRHVNSMPFSRLTDRCLFSLREFIGKKLHGISSKIFHRLNHH